MKTCFACGELMPGCARIFVGDDDDDILRQVADHAVTGHQIILAAGFADAVRAASSSVSDLLALRLTGSATKAIPQVSAPPTPAPDRTPVAGESAGQPADVLSAAFTDAPVAMALTNSDGGILQANRALAGLLGMAPERIPGLRLDDLVDESEMAAVSEGRQLVSGGSALRHRIEVHLSLENSVIPVEMLCAPVRAGGAPGLIIWHLLDITDRHADHRRLTLAARHDPLTGLPNRNYFFEQLEQALQRRHRDGSCVIVLFCDLDRFKSVNDTYGHQGGDEVLVEFANRLRATARATDVCARLAGDEFVVLYEHPSRPDPDTLIARIKRVMAAMFTVHDSQVRVQVSVGAAIADAERITAQELVRRADEAMYEAKSAVRRPGQS